GQIYAGLKSLGTPLSVFNGLAVNAGSSSVPATRGNCKNPAPGPTDPVGGDKVDNEDYARHQTDHDVWLLRLRGAVSIADIGATRHQRHERNGLGVRHRQFAKPTDQDHRSRNASHV